MGTTECCCSYEIFFIIDFCTGLKHEPSLIWKLEDKFLIVCSAEVSVVDGDGGLNEFEDANLIGLGLRGGPDSFQRWG